MKHRMLIKAGALFVALFLTGAAGLLAQSTLLENPNYRRALELQRMARQAYEQGDFQASVEHSREAERLSRIALEEAEIERMRWLAFNLRNRAFERISFAERENAATRYPDVWAQAQAAYRTADTAFRAEQYGPSVDASRQVIDLLAVVEPVRRAAPAATPAATLPAQYEVRLIPERRDCLWRIAEYPFVYGDPWKWPLLYEANKHKFPQPGNPHLIHPGMILDIPSIAGEKREGLWKPE